MVKKTEGGIVRRVLVVDESGDEVAVVRRFLSHLGDSGYSPNTLCAYAYDLRHLASFLDEHGVTWSEFRPSTALSFLAYLRPRYWSYRVFVYTLDVGMDSAGDCTAGDTGIIQTATLRRV